MKIRTVTIDSATGKTSVTTETITKTEEDVTPYQNIIISNPLGYFTAFNLNWMHKISDHIAGGLGIELGTTQDAWGFTGEFRFYTGDNSLHGFYIAPNVAYISGRGDFDDESLTFDQVQLFTVGVLAGWQSFPSSNFAFGLALGLDAYFALNNVFGPDYFSMITMSGEAATPVVRINIGYSW